MRGLLKAAAVWRLKIVDMGNRDSQAKRQGKPGKIRKTGSEEMYTGYDAPEDFQEEEFAEADMEYEEPEFDEQPPMRRRAREEDWEEEEDREDWEDEPQPMRPAVMVLIFLGLVVLAAVICGILWYFTHGDRDRNEPPSQSVATAEPAPEITAEPTLEPTAEPTVQPTPTAAAETPEPVVSPEVAASSEPAATPEAAPEQTATSVPSESASVQEPLPGNETMAFTAVQETVTPKDVINLRSLPSTSDAETIVAQAKNGETFARTGINNDSGWSRVEYNGQTLYAVSQYLTTDLTYTTPVQTSDPNRVSTKDGRVIIFTDCDDNISPKEYVNLRLEPSTSEGNSTVHCRLDYGEVAHRTGYSADSGWSRVEYDDKVLYVVTSMIYVVTE